MKFKKTILECVGQTPIVKLNRLPGDSPHEFYVKLEMLNPGSSIKDRIAIGMIEDAVKDGRLKPGGTIIECTSGNTGMGLAMVAAVRGFRCIFVMPDKVSDEKVKALRAFGARVIVTPTAVEPDDPRSYYSVAKRLAKEVPNSYYTNQYHNPSNPKAHFEHTGPEIWEQVGKEIDYVVIASGTGGTITGIMKYMKGKNPKVKSICVDPVGSIFYDYFTTKKIPKVLTTYKVEGFGEDFMPSTIDFSYIDEVVQVNDQECFQMTREMVQKEGIFAGGSCGGAVAGALKFAEKIEGKKKFLILLPDSGSRYLSKIYDDQWMRENGFLGSQEVMGPVRDVLGARKGRVVEAKRSNTVSEIAELMREHSISQVPVVDGGKLVGMIRETDLLDAMLSDSNSRNKNVDEYMMKKFYVVDPDDPMSKLSEIFKSSNIAIVAQDEQPVGVITKIDFIDFLSKRVKS